MGIAKGATRRVMPAMIGASAYLGLVEAGCAGDADPQAGAPTIVFKMEGGRSFTATLADNPSARDFLSLLPMSLTLKDYASTEKIADLPKRLSTDGAPEGFAPSAGDVAYYAPWGNLAIFHRDFRHSPGLIHLGRIQGDFTALKQTGPLDVRIERPPVSAAPKP
ncbi:cyclophilin-like fold protein [Enterovirga sp.]|uniref:cyclophilin-like fold protein n=1 Tax=Enterovirga sp. TaxID=2026350 RepID=UPI002D0351E6|nr:cyclophilin-like fold protein [Enterovirga sp.]HMO30453.1 cyclophilin-like fold protein [Enterovirga sp.]